MDTPPDISTNDSIKDTDMIVTDQSGSKSLQSEDDIDVEKVNMVVISSDDEVEIVGVSDQGSKTAPELQNGTVPAGDNKSTLTRDTTCSVCLSEFDNKAFLDKCFHAFCYFCILQWSEIVQTCPLCKSGFTSIIHSVKSMDNYQQHYLSNPGVNDPTNQSQSQSAAGRFRYRTTLAEGRRPHQQVPGRQRNQEGASDAWGQRARRREAYLSSLKNRKLMARERRRTVYFYNLWVEQVRQQGRLRHRDISPAFFRANPACSHRLIPWLTRELRVLLNDDENHMNFVLQMVLSLITKIEITSEEFCTQLQPFLFGQTEHFIHEFRSFAQSPFDVTAYDERAQYNWPSESRAPPTDTPTVFNSETTVLISSTGWQTPDTVPGPSGESVQELSRTDWTGENPSWSPNSSPGTSGLNIPSLPRPVVSGSSQTVSIHVDSLTGGNASSSQGGTKSRSVSVGENVVEGSSKESRRKHHHRHRHSKHKHKHKRKDRSNQDPGKCITLEIDADRPGPSHISIDSSSSGNSVDVVTVSSDDVFSPDVLLVKEECSGADVIPTVKTESKAGRSGSVKSRRHKKRPKSSSRCRSRKASHARRDTRSRSRSRTKQHVRDDNRSRSRSNTKQRVRDENRSRSKTKQHVKVESRSRSRSNTKHHTRGESRSRSNTKHHERSESRSRSSSNTKQHVRGESKSRSRSKTKRHGSRSRTRSQSRSRTNNRVLNGNKSQSRRIQRDHSSSGKEVASKKPRPEKEQVQAQRSRSRSTSKSSSKQKAVTETPSLDCSTFSKSPSTKSRSPVRHSPSHSCCSRKSQSPSRSSRASRSRSHAKSQSRERSGSRSRVHSLSVTDEATPLSNEDIQKEIGDLEFRIAADKKRLLQLLIKQEKTKGGLDSDRNEDEESVHVVAPEEQETHL